MAAPKDLTGQRFGRLTVLRLDPEPYRSPNTGKPTRRWVCRCDCGNETSVLANGLLSGSTQSCGCRQRETAAAQAVDLTGRRFGRWTVIARVPLAQVTSSGTRNGWLCRCDCGTERVVQAGGLISGASRSCGCTIAETAIRHINEDNTLGRYDGTVVSAIRPERGANRSSKSGVKGVYWSEREQRWIAKIGLRGKSITIGRFGSMEAAAKARQAAEEVYYGPILQDYSSHNDNDKEDTKQ